MKAVRTAVCFIFIISCAVFGLYGYRERMTKDTAPPEITCEEDRITVSVNAAEEELLQGITAKDDRDGDLTGSVRVSSMSHFIGEAKRTVNYIVFDQANNAAAFSRTLVYTDYRSPRIYLSQPLRYTSDQAYYADLTENMTADDCLDGDVSKKIRITRNTGSYSGEEYGEITVQVSNSAGDVIAIPMKVDFTDFDGVPESDKYYPALSVYIVYTSVGEKLDLQSFLVGVQNGEMLYEFGTGDEEDSEDWGDTEDSGIQKEDVKIESSVDYSQAGIYEVVYRYTFGEVTAAARLVVVVEE